MPSQCAGNAAEKLKHAERRIEATEDRLTAIKFRAQAEAEAREAKQALALVEEASVGGYFARTPKPRAVLAK